VGTWKDTLVAAVRLEQISEANVKAVFELQVAPEQQGFVAPNPWSLAQALTAPDIAWPRAIVAGNEVVGFLMLEIDPDEPQGRPFWLWRLMIGATHQRQGIGTAALTAAVDEVVARGGTELYTSWVEGDGGPEPFYRRLGFLPTGEVDDGEIVARLTVQPRRRPPRGLTAR
jgi:diamine N-acetyltransferase